MMFHYFIQDQTGHLRIGYIASASQDAATQMLDQAKIKQLIGLTKVPEDAVPKGARYMYPFAGLWNGSHMEGTVEGETVLSALEHLNEIFDGAIEYIAERAPVTPEERKRFAAQTTGILSKLAPSATPQVAEISSSETASAVATVLDRQFEEMLDAVQEGTKQLLHERQFAEEVREMHRVLFSAEQQGVDLKGKYDTLSYTLRELSYIEDGLDPSPVKKDMRALVDKVVGLLKKVEKSMVRTAFHMDNRRIREEDNQGSETEEIVAVMPDVALSRYASRKRLVVQVLESIRALQSNQGSMAMAGGPVMPISTDLPISLPTKHEEPLRTSGGTSGQAAEPLSHIFMQELPLLLEWFAGFSLLIIILGQVLTASGTPLLLGGYDLTEMLRPFAWQHIFLKTTLIAILALMGLRARHLFKGTAIMQWLSAVLLLIAGVMAIFVL